MNREAARTSLERFVRCLNQRFEGRFFAIDGTLLGLVRQGDFIDGDNDIDFGMRIEDYREALIDDLQASGFSLVASFGEAANGLGLHFTDGQILFDMLFFYSAPPTVWTAVYDRGEQIRGVHQAFDLETATLHGVDLLVPSPPQRYLETMYGRRWRTPVKTWDYRFAPHNLRANGRLGWRVRHAIKQALWRLIHHDIHLASATTPEGPAKPHGTPADRTQETDG